MDGDKMANDYPGLNINRGGRFWSDPLSANGPTQYRTPGGLHGPSGLSGGSPNAGSGSAKERWLRRLEVGVIVCSVSGLVIGLLLTLGGIPFG